jgi:ABC-2 type transport system ATP-binding protein
MTALEGLGLEKRYGSVLALAGVDLTVAPGELVGLIGANGAGKSTLMKIACGLVRPTAGTATVCGVPARTREARRNLGYLAELFRFPGWSTASEVLALHQQLAGSPRGRIERDALLELVGLSDAADRRVEGMSKGMQQRLGIAQALIGDPKAAPARRAHERARPRRPARRPDAPGRLTRPGHRRAHQLPPTR